MRKSRIIVWISVPALCALCFLLGWYCYNMYLFERGHVQEKVESSVHQAALKLLWYNGSLSSNYALMNTDKDYDSKLAFAAGFTQNRSKISVTFYDDDPMIMPPPPQKPLNVNKEFLHANNITYKPGASMALPQFDSVLKIELKRNQIALPYRITLSRKLDTARHDTLFSAPFIINFFEPHIYCLHYTLPPVLMLRRIAPYLGASALLIGLLVATVVFFYRSYKMQAQIAGFRETMFGNITHELKTPLTSLQLIVDEALISTAGGAPATVSADHVQFAASELRRMKLIVDKILSFSKMGRRQFAFNSENAELNSIISQSIAAMELNTKQAGGAMTFGPGEPVVIVGDPLLLINAVSSLIDNALKYTSRPPCISITLTRDPESATIAVHDNGIGIPPHIGRKVFEPFFRVPTGNVYNTAGHGLGLSFVQQTMKLHGGSVSYTSSENGTVFYLNFPMES